MAVVLLGVLVACSGKTEKASVDAGVKSSVAGPPSLAGLREANRKPNLVFADQDGELTATSSFGARLVATSGMLELSYRKGTSSLLVGLASVERGGALALARADDLEAGCASSADECVERVALDGVREEWQNRADALEHTFVIEAPGSSPGTVRLHVAFEGAETLVHAAGDAVDLKPAHGPELVYDGLLVKDASGAVVSAKFEAASSGVDIVFSDVGATYPIRVDPTLSRRATSRTWEGKDTGAFGELGASVASAGDVNGDGYDDILVGTGEPRADRLGYPERVSGEVFLFLGGPSGPLAAAWSAGWSGPEGSGATAMGVGDLNADGFADVAVYSTFGADEGSTAIYLGWPGGLRNTAATLRPAELTYPIGDVDGDGRADLAGLTASDAQVRVRYSVGQEGAERVALLQLTCSPDCPAGQTCEGGRCLCPGGTTRCGSVCAELSSDASHCGACSTACSAGEVCQAGACKSTCAAGTTYCAGRCTSVAEDTGNCGACGNACGLGESCAAGACKCALGESRCGAVCVNMTSDTRHCGGCDQACPVGQVCRTGTCQSTCASGSTLCGDQCVTLGDDPAHCGSCGTACVAGSVCASGACVAVASVDRVGCADGTREAFLDAETFPKIAACSGAWGLPGIFPAIAASSDPTCATAGNSSTTAPPDGAGCSAANLCAAGWHICNGGEVTPRTGRLGCAAERAYPASTFFAAAVSGTGCGMCALRSKPTTGASCTSTSCARTCQETGDLNNDFFGCGSRGANVPDPDCDGLNRFSHNNCSALGAPWTCSGGSAESRTLTKPRADGGGVLCCRD